MRTGLIVTVIEVGPRGCTVTLASGLQKVYVAGRVVKVPKGASITGDYQTLFDAKQPLETK